MKVKIPGFALLEPLRPRPLSATVIGALTGLAFGLLSKAGAFPTTWRSQVLGYLIGGSVVGLVIGASLPLFRRRWAAGLMVGAAAAVGFYVAGQSWGESWSAAMSLFLGACSGFVYAALLWDYKISPPKPLPNEELKPTASLSNLVE